MKRTLIHFKDQDIVSNFAGEKSIRVDRNYFLHNIDEFKKTIAICYGVSNYDQALMAKRNNIPFIYIDNAYFGNLSSYHCEHKPRKNFFRITVNATVLTKLIPRSQDRLTQQLDYLKYNYQFEGLIKDYKYDGKDIVIVPPTSKVLQVTGIDQKKWKDEVISKIDQNKYNIIIREREKSRHARFQSSPIQKCFENAYATITYNSIAAIDSLLFGVPSFIYDNTDKSSMIVNPAEPVSVIGLDKLDKRLFPTNRIEFLSHLAYGQFSTEEMDSGFARKFIIDEYNLRVIQ